MEKNLICFGAAMLVSASALSAAKPAKAKTKQADRPNIVLIMVDDMGYSDLGCFGGEIPTPNIDMLAQSGVRYTNFYNTARSCPTRASLLTGLYPHQTGIGAMTEDPYDTLKVATRRSYDNKAYGYKGSLNRDCVTLAEVLGSDGYHTYMSGKWHLGWDGTEKWPLQRGFDRFYGILAGATSYFSPTGMRALSLDNEILPAPAQPYYTTDAFTDYAMEFIDSHSDDDPFFLYLAYNAPHWPLQAKEEDIDRFLGKYDKGWEATREARYNKMVELGIIDQSWGLAEWENRTWSELNDDERWKSSLRMAVYAAQVYCVDYNVGRLVKHLDQKGELDNTLIIFFSDNGACAEPYSETGSGNIKQINDATSQGPPSYGKPWAQVSNTPFRKYKVRAYEGGITTAFIMSWPDKFSAYDGQIRRNTTFLPDIMATLVDAAGATYPTTFHDGRQIQPMVGASMLPTVSAPDAQIHDYIYGEHYDNRFVIWNQWKVVWDQDSKAWELYDIVRDRSERNNLAATHPALVEQLSCQWQGWSVTHHVFPKK